MAESPADNRIKVWTVAVLASMVPGSLAGVQLAGLLFFLNPHLPFAARPLLRAAVFYSTLLGLLSALLCLPFIRRRPEIALRILPWGLCLVFALAGTTDWIQASHFAYYLPGGINRRLIKAAFWLSLAALVSFFIALHHSLHGRRYRLASRLGLAVLAGLSIYVVLERREAFRPPLGNAPRPSSVELAGRPRLVVVGLEAATLDVILPLAEQGQLPFFATLLQEGVYGHLTSLKPARRAPLWTTLATGKYPYKHGVLDDASYTATFLPPPLRLNLVPAGLAFSRWGARTSSRFSAPEALTLWEILERLGVSTAVLGWPTPTEKELDLFAEPAIERDPSNLGQSRFSTSWKRSERVRLGSLSSFGKEASSDLKGILVDDLRRQGLARAWLEAERDGSGAPATEALFVALPGLRSVSKRYFGGYSATHFDGLQDTPYRTSAQIVSSYYAQLDLLLAELWNDLEPPRLLAVVSAHGARAAHGPEKIWAAISRRRALEGFFDGAPEGLLLLYGERLEAGTFLKRAHLTDVAPTLLYALGFPAARDFDGRVLTEAFKSSFLARSPLTFVPSYETLTKPQGARP